MLPIDLDLQTKNWTEADLVKYYASQAAYEAAVEKGEIQENEIAMVAAPDTSKFICNGVDGTLYWDYNKYEFDEDGVQISNLKNITAIEKALFEAFKKQMPDKAEDWNTLLKMNQGDYEVTIRQIMEVK